jgi:two-component system response regulator AtoC
VLLSDTLPRDAPADDAPGQPWLPTDGPLPTLAEAERRLIERALELTHGHKGRACQMLGISRPTLERKLARYATAQSVKPPLKSVS